MEGGEGGRDQRMPKILSQIRCLLCLFGGVTIGSPHAVTSQRELMFTEIREKPNSMPSEGGNNE